AFLDDVGELLFHASGRDDRRAYAGLRLGAAPRTPLESHAAAGAHVALHLLDPRRDGLRHRLAVAAPRAFTRGRVDRAGDLLGLPAAVGGPQGAVRRLVGGRGCKPTPRRGLRAQLTPGLLALMF